MVLSRIMPLKCDASPVSDLLSALSRSRPGFSQQTAPTRLRTGRKRTGTGARSWEVRATRLTSASTSTAARRAGWTAAEPLRLLPARAQRRPARDRADRSPRVFDATNLYVVSGVSTVSRNRVRARAIFRDEADLRTTSCDHDRRYTSTQRDPVVPNANGLTEELLQTGETRHTKRQLRHRLVVRDAGPRRLRGRVRHPVQVVAFESPQTATKRSSASGSNGTSRARTKRCTGRLSRTIDVVQAGGARAPPRAP